MPATEKLDLFKLHKAEYAAPKKPALIDIAPSHYLAVHGEGEPGGAAFDAGVSALYAMSYTIKFACKAEGSDFGVCKLEGLWTIPDGKQKSEKHWQWTLLIRMPEFVTKKHLAEARKALREKKEGDFDSVELLPLKEGACVQMLHVGPYDKEQETIDQMNDFAAVQSLKPGGAHHEIYLSDPRRVPPEKLRTILRQPVRKS